MSIIPLGKAVAFNPAYIAEWDRYYTEHGEVALADKLERLVANMDTQSEAVCRHQASFIRHVFRKGPRNVLQIDTDDFLKILPDEVREELAKIFKSDTKAQLEALKVRLNLAQTPLPELLVMSGLAFVNDAKAFIEGRPVIDGGAYIGDTAAMLIEIFGAGEVHSFEPFAASFDALSDFAGTSPGKIRPIRAGLGEMPGEMELWGKGIGASVIKKASRDPLVADTVPLLSIDSYVEAEGLEGIGLIKLDVEGAEMAAIRGARRTIERFRPLMLISIYHTAKDFYEIKPLLESWSCDYKFVVRKTTPDLIKEFVLLCVPGPAKP